MSRVGLAAILVVGAICLMIMDCVQGYSRDDAVEQKCAVIKKDCINTGGIFKRSFVCASNGKRYINECALQLRSCELYLETGEVIMEERCLWVDIVEGEDKEEEQKEEEEEGEEEEENENEHPPASDYDSQTTVDMVYATTGMNSYTVEAGHDSIQFSESADDDFKQPPEDIIEEKLCSCRGDMACPSCIASHGGLGGPVCATNGETYKTQCDLDTERCEGGNFDLNIEHDGNCASTTKHGNEHVAGNSGRGHGHSRGDIAVQWTLSFAFGTIVYLQEVNAAVRFWKLSQRLCLQSNLLEKGYLLKIPEILLLAIVLVSISKFTKMMSRVGLSMVLLIGTLSIECVKAYSLSAVVDEKYAVEFEMDNERKDGNEKKKETGQWVSDPEETKEEEEEEEAIYETSEETSTVWEVVEQTTEEKLEDDSQTVPLVDYDTTNKFSPTTETATGYNDFYY